MKIAILNFALHRDIRILSQFTFGCKNRESQTVGVEGEKGEKQQQSVFTSQNKLGERATPGSVLVAQSQHENRLQDHCNPNVR
jgi:hypothetical protein